MYISLTGKLNQTSNISKDFNDKCRLKTGPRKLLICDNMTFPDEI